MMITILGYFKHCMNFFYNILLFVGYILEFTVFFVFIFLFCPIFIFIYRHCGKIYKEYNAHVIKFLIGSR